MLLQASNSFLLLVDIQTRLAKAIHSSAQVVNSASWLVDIARQLNIPVRVTEQYPQGLGATVSPLLAKLQPNEILPKTHFSAWQEPAIASNFAALERKQLVVAGTEAHVCVLQTVVEMLAAGYQVFVVVEAVGSRQPQDKRLALDRMQRLGAQLVSQEMVAFEWLHKSGTDDFRRLMQGWIK